jgi:alpha-L-arabinofuranosidase
MLAGAMPETTRRTLLAAPSLAAFQAGSQPSIVVDPAPLYPLSSYLYMQFMEPLGATDGSVEAAWNHRTGAWREDVIEVTRGLSPTMLRWGGIFADYYRWREGVGPREKRLVMRNLLWGGVESNQVGTAEFTEFARRTGAEPLICVNFESDGRAQFASDGGFSRTGDAREAAEWVAYCNSTDHAERRSHGHAAPLRVPFWQIGNETSYDPKGFQLDVAQKKTVEFARAMKAADPSIQLIGWGDEDFGARGRKQPEQNWTRGMAEAAGEYLSHIAFHHMYNPDDRHNPGLAGFRYRKDPARTWEILMDAWKPHDAKIRAVRDRLGSHKIPLALTECHYSIPGRNRCEVMSTWACGVSYARLLNVHERHGDLLKIATAADFCGTRWQVNALMIPVPGGQPFLMPVAQVMKLYRHHTGEQAVRVVSAPGTLDVTASRTGAKLFLHVANTDRTRAVDAALEAGNRIAAAKAWQIATDPMTEMEQETRDQFEPKEVAVAAPWVHTFPAASVTAVELTLAG